MDKLQLPHAKLLYFISELWKQKEITDNEKLAGKEKVISDDPTIFAILDEYEENGNTIVFKHNLIKLVKKSDQLAEYMEAHEKSHEVVAEANEYSNDVHSEEEEESEQINNVNGVNPVEYENQGVIQDNSPLGNALFHKKHNKKEGVKVLKDVLRPMPK